MNDPLNLINEDLGILKPGLSDKEISLYLTFIYMKALKWDFQFGTDKFVSVYDYIYNSVSSKK